MKKKHWTFNERVWIVELWTLRISLGLLQGEVGES